MKKFFVILAALIMCFNVSDMAYCATNQPAIAISSTTDWTKQTNLNRVNKIGKALLQKNNLPSQVTFTVVETDEINAFANGENQICVYTGLLNFVNDDSELAGVIAHEIGHIVNNHVAKQSIVNAITATVIQNAKLNEKVKTGAAIAQNLSMKKMSRNEEYEADITAVDLMVKAGYNPLAMVSVLYKISGNYVDIIQDHPSGDKRTMYLYNYITYTYPDKLKLGYNSDSFKQFMNYAQPIVDARNANPSKVKAFNNEQAKLKEKRLKKLQKYKNATNELGWQASYTLLKTLTSEQ